MGRIATYITAGSKLGSSQTSNKCLSKSALTGAFPGVDASKLTRYASNQLVAIEDVGVTSKDWFSYFEQLIPFPDARFFVDKRPNGFVEIRGDGVECISGSYAFRIETRINVIGCALIDIDPNISNEYFMEGEPSFVISFDIDYMQPGHDYYIWYELFLENGVNVELKIVFNS